MWRLRRYLYPYRWRFVIMIVFAGAGDRRGDRVPLVTKTVIDGPIADSDRAGSDRFGLLAIALGVLEAALMFLRRWIVVRGTIGVETGIRPISTPQLQRLPMSFHGRWESGQLLSRMMNDLSTIRRFLGFGVLFLIMNIAADRGGLRVLLLSMYWPLGLIVLASVVPIAIACLRNERQYTRLSREIQDQIGDVASSVEEGAYGLRVIKAFGRARHVFKTFDARSTKLYRTSLERVRLSARFWTFLKVIPNVTADPRARAGRGRRRPGPAQPRHAGRLHHPAAVPGLAGRGARLPAGHDPGGDDRGRPDRRDLRRRERDRRRQRIAAGSAGPGPLRPGLVPLPGRRHRPAARPDLEIAPG